MQGVYLSTSSTYKGTEFLTVTVIYLSNFIIHISFQLDELDLWYFKLRLFDLTELIVWNIKGLQDTTFGYKDYKDLKSWVWGKNSVLLQNVLRVK